MYGFVETWIPELLGIQYEKYPLSDGVEAAIIYEGDFKKLLNILLSINSHDNLNPFPGVWQITSSVRGMNIILMKYWVDETVLYSLTDGDIKNNDKFLQFMNMTTPRFNFDQLQKKLIDAWRINPSEERSGAIDTETLTEMLNNVPRYLNSFPIDSSGVITAPGATLAAVDVVCPESKSEQKTESKADIKPEPEVKPAEISKEEKIKIEGIKFIDAIKSAFDLNDINTNITKNGNIVLTTTDLGSTTRTAVFKFAEKIKKNVVFTKFTVPRIINILKKKDTAEIFKHTIVFDAYPSCNSNANLFLNNANTSNIPDYPGTVCFGKSVNKLYLVRGTEVNVEIQKVKSDSYFSDKEKTEKIKNIIDTRVNSPFFKYDCVFKDTYTNNIFAVKQKCIVYLLFEYWSENTAFTEICLNEIARRINKDIPYEKMIEIDKEYFDKLATSNMNEYIEFSINSSKGVYNDIFNKLERDQENFKKYSDLLISTAKNMKQYQDMLDVYDSGCFEEKEKEKAKLTYLDTLKIEKILTIYINDENIHVFTKNLYAKDPRTQKYHDIGTFHIIIGMLTSSYNKESTVRIFNTKYGGMGMNNKFQAPHVWDDGHICHGNLITSMVEAYKNRNLFDLVYQILIFLETANVDDGAGIHVNTWPEVSDEEALYKEENKDIIFMYDKKDEAEQKFDDVLADSLPIKIKVEEAVSAD